MFSFLMTHSLGNVVYLQSWSQTYQDWYFYVFSFLFQYSRKRSHVKLFLSWAHKKQFWYPWDHDCKFPVYPSERVINLMKYFNRWKIGIYHLRFCQHFEVKELACHAISYIIHYFIYLIRKVNPENPWLLVQISYPTQTS